MFKIFSATILLSFVFCIYAGAADATKSAQSAPTQTASADKGISVPDDDKTVTYDCNGRDVSVDGDGNTVTLNGTCGSISVDGDENKITVDKTSAITVTGDDNKITWGAAVSGDKPAISDQGDDNVIRKKQ